MDIYNLAKVIFNKKPEQNNSILVQFENIKKMDELFETLIIFFTEGMKIHYINSDNNKVDLNKLKWEDFYTIKKYFKSINIQLNILKYRMETNNQFISCYETGDSIDFTSNMLLNYKQINSNDLKDYKFNIKVNKYLYVIFFNIN